MRLQTAPALSLATRAKPIGKSRSIYPRAARPLTGPKYGKSVQVSFHNMPGQGCQILVSKT
jgi:hypothetical protein